MKSLIIKRPQESFNTYADYRILIDGVEVSTLSNSETKTIEVNENAQTLKAKLFWCGSHTMDISNLGEDAEIDVSGNAFLNKKLPIFACFLPILGVSFTGSMMAKVIACSVIGLVTLFIFGMLTIGRNQWINNNATTH